MMAVRVRKEEENNKRYQRAINLTRKELHFQKNKQRVKERGKFICKDLRTHIHAQPALNFFLFNDGWIQIRRERNAKNINSFSNEKIFFFPPVLFLKHVELKNFCCFHSHAENCRVIWINPAQHFSFYYRC
jgi:hypothetical protein